MFGIIDLTTPPPAYVNIVHEFPHLMRRAMKEGLDPLILGYGMRVKAPKAVVGLSSSRLRMRLLYPNGLCSYCGEPMGDDDTVDHVEPRSRGGAQYGIGNLVPACKACNNAKGDHTPAEMGWNLRITPRMPNGRGWVVRGVERPLPQWSDFLERAA